MIPQPLPIPGVKISYKDNLQHRFFRECFEARYDKDKKGKENGYFSECANYACIRLKGLGEISPIDVSEVTVAHSERVILAQAINWAIGIARKQGLPQGNIEPIDLKTLRPENKFTDWDNTPFIRAQPLLALFNIDLFSERHPCDTKGQRCYKLLQETLSPHHRIYYAVEHTPNNNFPLMTELSLAEERYLDIKRSEALVEFFMVIKTPQETVCREIYFKAFYLQSINLLRYVNSFERNLENAGTVEQIKKIREKLLECIDTLKTIFTDFQEKQKFFPGNKEREKAIKSFIEKLNVLIPIVKTKDYIPSRDRSAFYQIINDYFSDVSRKRKLSQDGSNFNQDRKFSDETAREQLGDEQASLESIYQNPLNFHINTPFLSSNPHEPPAGTKLSQSFAHNQSENDMNLPSKAEIRAFDLLRRTQLAEQAGLKRESDLTPKQQAKVDSSLHSASLEKEARNWSDEEPGVDENWLGFESSPEQEIIYTPEDVLTPKRQDEEEIDPLLTHVTSSDGEIERTNRLKEESVAKAEMGHNEKAVLASNPGTRTFSSLLSKQRDEEILKERKSILRAMKAEDPSAQGTVSSTTSESGVASALVLAPAPIQPVDANMGLYESMVDSYERGKPKLENLLQQKGLSATEVSGSQFNCFINTLLQHARKQYKKEQFEDNTIAEIKRRAGVTETITPLYYDTPEAQEILKVINTMYNVNLQVYFFQINDEGKPIFSPGALEDATSQHEKQPIVIWQQPGHYVAIVSDRLCQLTDLNNPESKTDAKEKDTHSEEMQQIFGRAGQTQPFEGANLERESTHIYTPESDLASKQQEAVVSIHAASPEKKPVEVESDSELSEDNFEIKETPPDKWPKQGVETVTSKRLKERASKLFSAKQNKMDPSRQDTQSTSVGEENLNIKKWVPKNLRVPTHSPMPDSSLPATSVDPVRAPKKDIEGIDVRKSQSVRPEEKPLLPPSMLTQFHDLQQIPLSSSFLLSSSGSSLLQTESPQQHQFQKLVDFLNDIQQNEDKSRYELEKLNDNLWSIKEKGNPNTLGMIRVNNENIEFYHSDNSGDHYAFLVKESQYSNIFFSKPKPR